MTELIQFPGLGLSFEISRVAFSIGGYRIYWYGILFAAAFVAGICLFQFRARRFGIHPSDGVDVVLCAVVGGLIGARVYYVIFSWDMYRDNPLKIFALREGGLAIYGGVIGAMIVAWIAARFKKLPFLPLADAACPGLMLGQAIGRWGNFFNTEAFGSNTTLPWGMTSPTISAYLSSHQVQLAQQGVSIDPSAPVHPTFLYESVWCLLGVLVLCRILTPRRRFDGEILLAYLGWYGLERALVEGLRTDSLMLGAFRVSQLLSAVLFVGASVLLLKGRIGQKKLQTGELTKRKMTGLFDLTVLYADTRESREYIARTEQKIASGKEKGSRKDAAEKQQTSMPLSESDSGQDNPEHSKENADQKSAE